MVDESHTPQIENPNKFLEVIARIKAKKDTELERLVFPLQELSRRKERVGQAKMLDLALNDEGLSLDNLATLNALGNEAIRDVVRILKEFFLAKTDAERQVKAKELAAVMSA